MSEEKQSFTVNDKRIFSGEKSSAEKEDAPVENNDSKKTDRSREYFREEPALPKIDFSTFIFSLNSSVLVQLGLIEDPASGKKAKNLPLAKQTIDIMGMLEEKTRGNLTQDEEQMLKHFLYELRMLYVKEKR